MCNALFSIDHENSKTDVLVFTKNMTLLNRGHFLEDSKRKVIVQDANIISMKQNIPCGLKYPVTREFGHPYILNMVTENREPISAVEENLCQEINDIEEVEDKV